mmetsp:Transcript_24875/g.37576  ORF Transcript_24875/g.37576 Transcript_24875/m.37576 type:complete len:283 (+) Transcript_24875:345-1193(+)
MAKERKRPTRLNATRLPARMLAFRAVNFWTAEVLGTYPFLSATVECFAVLAFFKSCFVNLPPCFSTTFILVGVMVFGVSFPPAFNLLSDCIGDPLPVFKSCLVAFPPCLPAACIFVAVTAFPLSILPVLIVSTDRILAAEGACVMKGFPVSCRPVDIFFTTALDGAFFPRLWGRIDGEDDLKKRDRMLLFLLVRSVALLLTAEESFAGRLFEDNFCLAAILVVHCTIESANELAASILAVNSALSFSSRRAGGMTLPFAIVSFCNSSSWVCPKNAVGCKLLC